MIAAYIEQHSAAAPTVKQHLAALRMLFDWLVIGQIMPVNPASAVRGPKHVVRKGKTPVLSSDETRTLYQSRSIGGRDDESLNVQIARQAEMALDGLPVAVRMIHANCVAFGLQVIGDAPAAAD